MPLKLSSLSSLSLPAAFKKPCSFSMPTFPQLSKQLLLGLVPYFFFALSFFFQVGAMADFGLRSDNPTCLMWDEASLQYGSVSSFLSDHPSLLPEGVGKEEAVPKNHYKQWATACHWGHSWLFFGLWFCVFTFFLTLFPVVFQMNPAVVRKALPWVSFSFLFICFWELISVYCFFGLGDAWTYSYDCQLQGEGESALCGYMDRHGKFLAQPHPDLQQYFSGIKAVPFFQAYALSSYADSCATLTTLSLFFSISSLALLWLQYRDVEVERKEEGRETKPHSPCPEQLSKSESAVTRGGSLPMTFGMPEVEQRIEHLEEGHFAPEDLTTRY